MGRQPLNKNRTERPKLNIPREGDGTTPAPWWKPEGHFSVAYRDGAKTRRKKEENKGKVTTEKPKTAKGRTTKRNGPRREKNDIGDGRRCFQRVSNLRGLPHEGVAKVNAKHVGGKKPWGSKKQLRGRVA